MLEVANAKQPDNVAKRAKVIVDMLTKTGVGVAEGTGGICL